MQLFLWDNYIKIFIGSKTARECSAKLKWTRAKKSSFLEKCLEIFLENIFFQKMLQFLKRNTLEWLFPSSSYTWKKFQTKGLKINCPLGNLNCSLLSPSRHYNIPATSLNSVNTSGGTNFNFHRNWLVSSNNFILFCPYVKSVEKLHTILNLQNNICDMKNNLGKGFDNFSMNLVLHTLPCGHQLMKI